jgi:hypothetical protein
MICGIFKIDVRLLHVFETIHEVPPDLAARSEVQVLVVESKLNAGLEYCIEGPHTVRGQNENTVVYSGTRRKADTRAFL